MLQNISEFGIELCFPLWREVREKDLLSKYHLLKMLSLLQCALLASLSKTIRENRWHECEEEYRGVFWKFEGRKRKGEML